MRIIAGAAKGTKLAVPKKQTRPMTGRARESVFSILYPHLSGASVLDLYAGSGSLGLESLSRGADRATFVEMSHRAATDLRSNIEAVGLGGSVVVSSVEDAFGRLEGPYDLIFADPPYALGDEDVSHMLAGCDRLLALGGMIVVHRQAKSRISVPEFLTSVDERRYGDAVITMMERADR